MKTFYFNQSVIQNFTVKAKTVEEANTVNLSEYTFIKHSDTRDCYIFKRRAGK